MLINKNDKFSIRKFKNGRSDSVKIGAIGVIVGTAIALSAGANSAEAAMKENSDNTTTISNDKGSVIVDTANIQNPDEGRQFSTDPTENGTNTITKTGKVDYKYVTAEGNSVLEENKNQNSGADKTIETPYDVYGKSGEVFKGTTGGDAESSDLDNAKETGKKETIEKDGKTYHLIGDPKVETTGDGGGVYSDTTLGDVTAKLTPEGLNNAEGKITYDTVKPGGKAWIVEQTGKGTYGKYVQANSGDITSDDKMRDAFKAGEATAKNFTSANVTADGGIKEGDYVFVLEKNTYVTAKKESFSLTAQIQLSSSDNVADSKDGAGATLNRTYEMVQNFKAAPDTLTGDANKAFVKKYLAYLQEKGREDNLLNFKQYITIGMEAEAGTPAAIIADKGDQVDDKGRPTTDITADIASVSESDSSTIEDTPDFLLKLNSPEPEVEEYSYRDEITPLRAYRLASGTTTITYKYAEEKTREIEKKGSVVVNYQTEDGTELKAPYTDTPETVAEVVTEHYYVNADGQEVVVEDKTVRTPKNVAYNTKENETEKPEKLTDAQGNVYYLKADATKTAVNDVEKDAPAETGTVVEGVTKVTYIYEKAGSVIVNYKTVDGTPLTGTVVGDESKTVVSGTKDVDNGKPGTAYNTADNGLKPERIKTAEGKVYQLVPESTEGKETGEVVAGETKVVTYVYKEVKGNVVVKYEDTEGNTLAADEQDETDASLNVKYDTADHKKESITKDGVKYYLTAKELKEGSKPENGAVVEGTTEITYVYEKAGQVVVHYVDEAGNTLQADAVDTKDGKPGAKYDTSDNDMKPTRITTPEGKVFELVPASTKGNENGSVEAGKITEVTYVYKEVKGNVVVHYTDEAGNTIAEDVKDTTDGSVSSAYDTTDNKPATITTKDGKVYVLVPTATKGDENGKVTEGTTEVTYVYKDVKEEASKAIDKALSEKESKIKENPELTNEEKEKAIEEAKKSAEKAKKALEKAKTPEDVEKSTTKGKEDVEKTPVTPEDKPKAKEEIDKALENKVKKIDENPNLTPEQKEKAKEEAKKKAEEAKKTIDKAPSKEEVEKAKENGKKEVEKDTPTPDKPSNPSTDNPTNPSEGDKDKPSNPSEGDKDKPSNPSEGDKDKPYTPSPEDKAKAKETVDKKLEEKIKNIDKDPSLTPEQKEKAKEEAKKEAEKVKKSIEEGKTTEWVDEKGNPIKPVTPGTYPAGSTPNYELVGTVTNPETGKVTHIFKPVTKEEKTTVWVDVNGKPLKPAKPGTEEAGKVPNYKLVGTTVDPTTGNVIHVFTPTPIVNKVTEWVDTEGKVIRPKEEGSKVPGKVPSYELVGTVTNPETGKVTHIFKPTTSGKPSTVWVDVNGKPLKPTAPGKEEAGSVPNYKLVRTVTNPETGDVIHVFTPAPVVNNVTEWVDTEGKVIRPTKPGTEEAGKVPNYELVGTVTNPETGKVTHIFKPATKQKVTAWVDVNGKPVRPLAKGENPAGSVSGYELVKTIVDPETGNTLHVFKPKGSENPGTPGTPGENPGNPGTPGQNPGNPGTPANPEKPMDPNSPAKPEGERSPVDVVKSQFKRLANTGNETTNTAAAGFGALIAGIAVAVRRRQKKDK